MAINGAAPAQPTQGGVNAHKLALTCPGLGKPPGPSARSDVNQLWTDQCPKGG